MSRKKRLLLFPLGVLAVLIGIPCCLTWREVRHERLNQQLIEAIKREDTATALSALAQGADANARDEKQTLPAWKVLWNRLRGKRPAPSTAPTALLLALEWKRDARGKFVYPRENVPLIQSLLTHGAQVNVRYEDGDPPLTYALDGGKSATSRLLILHGANVMSYAWDVPLRAACGESDIDADIVEMMLQRGAEPDGPNWISISPLASAVIKRSPDKVRLLLCYHANPNVYVDEGTHRDSALSDARRFAKSDPRMRRIEKMLKAAGAKE